MSAGGLDFKLSRLKLPDSSRITINSLTDLLNAQRVPLPEERLTRKLFSQRQPRKSQSGTPILESREAKSQEADIPSSLREKGGGFGELKTILRSKQQFKFRLLRRLRETWQSEGQSQNHPSTLRTAGKGHARNKTVGLPSEARPTWDRRVEPASTCRGPRQTAKFLKKGTSIKRLVVTNLINLKIAKKQTEQTDLNINDGEILSLIRVFKGCEEFQDLRKFKGIAGNSVTPYPKQEYTSTPLRNQNIPERPDDAGKSLDALQWPVDKLRD